MGVRGLRMRRHRIAVGPFRGAAEVKRPGEIVGRGFPALGERRHGLGGLRVVLDEALEERGDEVEGLLVGDEVGVEVVGLGEIADVDDLGAIAGFDGGLAFPGAAGGEDERGGDEENSG